MGKQEEWVKQITLICDNCHHVGLEHMTIPPHNKKDFDVSVPCKKCISENKKDVCKKFKMSK